MAMVSAQAMACDASSIVSAKTGAQVDAFSQFAGAIKAAQARSASAAGRPGGSLAASTRGSITGMWRFAWTAPDGSPIDWVFRAWHTDGTEITNSGGRPAKNGSFCLGVWEQHGGAYNLNHWAIAWGLPPDFSDDSDLSGLVNIHETVSVDRSGNSMSGTVSLDFYAQDGTFMGHIVDGTVAGVRITP
ncbi:MAG TPA: hypothetical protein VGH81_06910 [Rudaea sp.]